MELISSRTPLRDSCSSWVPDLGERRSSWRTACVWWWWWGEHLEAHAQEAGKKAGEQASCAICVTGVRLSSLAQPAAAVRCGCGVLCRAEVRLGNECLWRVPCNAVLVCGVGVVRVLMLIIPTKKGQRQHKTNWVQANV